MIGLNDPLVYQARAIRWPQSKWHRFMPTRQERGHASERALVQQVHLDAEPCRSFNLPTQARRAEVPMLAGWALNKMSCTSLRTSSWSSRSSLPCNGIRSPPHCREFPVPWGLCIHFRTRLRHRGTILRPGLPSLPPPCVNEILVW